MAGREYVGPIVNRAIPSEKFMFLAWSYLWTVIVVGVIMTRWAGLNMKHTALEKAFG